MPANIPFAPTSVSQLKAPDVTKAGSIFSQALSGLSETVEGIADVNIARAESTIQDQIRQAQTIEETSGITADPLRELGAGASQIGALEASLKQRQSSILGKDINMSFDAQFEDNAQILESTFTSDPAFAQALSIDEAGTLTANIPTGKVGSQEYVDSKANIDATIQRFNALATESGFSPIKNDRELAREIRAQADEIGATTEQKNALVNEAKAYRNSLNTLSPEEQAIAAQQAADIDAQIVMQNQSLDAQAQNVFTTFGFTGVEAVAELGTSRSDAAAFVDANIPTELSIFTGSLTQKGGVDIKEHITELFNEGLTIGGRKATVEPWMVLRALQQVADLEPGSENIDVSDFNDVVFDIAASDEKAKLLQASQMSGRITAQKLVNEQRAIQAKRQALLDLKRSVGIRDTAANRAFINRPAPQPQETVATAPLQEETPVVSRSLSETAVATSLQEVLNKVLSDTEKQKLTVKQKEAVQQIEESASP